VDISVEQIDSTSGTTLVMFDYNGVVKTYRIVFTPWIVWGDVMEHRIVNHRPTFEGAARVAWGDVIGFLDDGDPPGAVTFFVNAPETGTYMMHVLHTVLSDGASHYWQINGGEPIAFEYPPDEGWITTEFPEKIELNEGENTVRIAFRSGIAEVRWVELQQYVGYPDENSDDLIPVLGWLVAAEPQEEEPTEQDAPTAVAPTDRPAETPTEPIAAVQVASEEASGNSIILIIVIAVIIFGGAAYFIRAKSKKS